MESINAKLISRKEYDLQAAVRKGSSRQAAQMRKHQAIGEPIDPFVVFLPVVPLPKERARTTRSGHTYTPENTANYERVLRCVFAGLYGRRPPITGPIGLEVVFYLPRPKTAPKGRTFHRTKPDLDNLLKSVEDALDFCRGDQNRKRNKRNRELPVAKPLPPLEWGAVIDNDSRIVRTMAEKRYDDDPGNPYVGMSGILLTIRSLGARE
jgi:Holliday junction resolvase RusA-like endonuclease